MKLPIKWDWKDALVLGLLGLSVYCLTPQALHDHSFRYGVGIGISLGFGVACTCYRGLLWRSRAQRDEAMQIVVLSFETMKLMRKENDNGDSGTNVH